MFNHLFDDLGMQTPSFDLSKVRPVRQHFSLNENDLLASNRSPQSTAPPTSTFRSTFPAVLREALEKIDIDAVCPEEVNILPADKKDKQTKVVSAVYQHPLAPPKIQGIVESEKVRHGSLPGHFKPSELDTLDPNRFSSISRKSRRGMNPIAAIPSPNIEEISQRARSKSVATSKIDWTNLP